MAGDFGQRLRDGFVSTGISFDSTAFREEFRKRVLRSKKTLAEITNEVAFQILRRAWKLTPKADRSQIEALGITYRVTNKKGTKLLKKRKAIISPTTAFKLIRLKALWMFGPKPRTFANRAALDSDAAKKLGRRSSSVGFIASGWVPAMKAIIRKIHGQTLTGGGLKTFKATKGGAKPAEESFNPFVEIENATGMNAPNQTSTSQNRVYNELAKAFEQAVDEETADMARHDAALHATLDGK